MKKKYVVAPPPQPEATEVRSARAARDTDQGSQEAKGSKKPRYVIAPPPDQPQAGRDAFPGVKMTGGAPKGPPRTPGRDRRGGREGQRPSAKKRALELVLKMTAVLVAFALTYAAALLWRFDSSMHRSDPDVSSALAPGGLGAINILVAGSDSREGSNTFVPGDARPGLSDVVMIVQVRWNKVKLLSIPRDTRVVLGRHGEQKVNAALALGGPRLLVEAVTQLTGLRIHRFLAVDFAGFVELTDSLGGVELCLDNAERDAYSGLSLPAGCQTVGGEQALAYVRSRHTEVLRDGRWTPDTGGDFSRMARQQRYFEALASRMQNPWVVATKGWMVSRRLGDALTADRGFGYLTEVRTGLAMALSRPESYTLPGKPLNKGGISYVEIDKAEAAPVLANFR